MPRYLLALMAVLICLGCHRTSTRTSTPSDPHSAFLDLKQRLDQYMVGKPLTDTSMFSSLPKTLSDEMKQILVLSERLDLGASEGLFISQVDWLLKRERVYDACHFNRWNVHPGIGPHVWLGELLDRSTDLGEV